MLTIVLDSLSSLRLYISVRNGKQLEQCNISVWMCESKKQQKHGQAGKSPIWTRQRRRKNCKQTRTGIEWANIQQCCQRVCLNGIAHGPSRIAMLWFELVMCMLRMTRTTTTTTITAIATNDYESALDFWQIRHTKLYAWTIFGAIHISG